jgi:RHS repeat-associated protein
VTPGNSESFSYDTLQRLTQAQGGYGSYAYTYDGDGNRSSETLGTITGNFGYQSGSDLLTSISVGGTLIQGFGYAADGSINTFNPSSEAPSGYQISGLTYNQDARLSTLTSNGEAAIGFAYDGFGQRFVAENIPTSYGTIYQYGQGGQLLEEADAATGAARADYIYVNGRAIAVLNPGTATLSFLHDDRLGTPQFATDSGQNIVWQTTYDPFGNTGSISGTITQDLRLPGQVFDPMGGEYLNGFRDYLPLIGRYMESDPIGRLGSGNNLYAYVFDNPTNLIDPLGLGAPNNGQEPPPACQAKILNATNNQFGTNYTNSNVTSTFNYSTGAGPGQGTLNLNISGSTAGVSTGYYPVHWWTYAIGFGPTLHVVGGDVLDSPQTLQFGPNQGTFHIDSGFPYNPIGAFAHWLLNMTKVGGYPKC